MKQRLRSLIECAFRRLPVSRTAYLQRDLLRARVDALDAALARPSVLPPEIRDPCRLETLVPVIRTLEERTLIAASCRDADVLPKVANAGAVVRREDGVSIQIMHNGVKVLAGGYYGAWMQDLITRCHGHHEPQEELLFAEVLRHLPSDATMIELGGFWSFYSIWFLLQDRRHRSFIVEADPGHLEIGRMNAGLNDCAPVFIPAFVGAQAAPPSPFQTEASGLVELPCVSVAHVMETHGIDHLNLLHCDAQGVELTVIESCLELAAAGRVSWLVVSTHSHHISNDPLTHQRCLAALRQAGAAILAEHDVQESFSGDGLIVAKFGATPAGWNSPRLSFNRYSESLFRNPLYDLAQATAQAASAAPPSSPSPLVPLDHSPCLATAGGLFAITADCALGVAGDTILLPFDKVIFPHVMAHSGWGLETHEFLDLWIDLGRSYTLLDIGANVGLFTRQAALRYPNIVRILCVEAEPGNFRALHYNLSNTRSGRCVLWNVALSDVDGDARFFRDGENFGNYSLNDDAMRYRPFDTIIVRTVETEAWMRAHVPAADGGGLVWKSDTQGYDELIISLTPQEIWDRVEMAIVELWRIRKPAFDQEAFFRRIDGFANKSIGLGNVSTTSDVAAFLQGEDWEHADLYLWR